MIVWPGGSGRGGGVSVYSVAAAAAAAQSLSVSVSLSRDQRVIGPAPRPPRPIGRADLTTFTSVVKATP